MELKKPAGKEGADCHWRRKAATQIIQHLPARNARKGAGFYTYGWKMAHP
ncbi:hypothetical protein AA0229_1988 [Gluconobacter cerinus NRIC 0229]|nr:hypothetical protein AA0229_1988 [Gluconobacter cerinus NRIC 0229]